MLTHGLMHFQSLFHVGFDLDEIRDKYNFTIDLIHNELLHRYTEPHRVYHTIDHIESLGRLYYEWCGTTRQPASREMCLAILYHDIIYDTSEDRAINNETNSALMFQSHAGMMGLSDELTDIVVELIHSTNSKHSNNSRLTDLDLTILAGEKDQYIYYSRAIRKEWVRYPDSIFMPERLKFLHSMLAKPNIFKDEAFKRYEERARQNLSNEIRVLNDQGTPFGNWSNTQTMIF